MSVAVSNRKWYRLHASTWVVALLAVAVLVLLVVPGAFARTDFPYGYQPAYVEHGWPWPFLEHPWVESGDWNDVPWLRARAWQFEGDVAWGFLAADAGCALCITVGVAAVWELRRRRRERLWHVTLSELLLATLAVAGILGWWRANVREAARQLSVVDALDKDYGRGYCVGHSTFEGPVWLYRLTGQRPDGMERVTSLIVVGSETPRRRPSAELVRSIATLTHVEVLRLNRLAGVDGDLAPLRGLSRLSRLSIDGCEIGEQNGAVLASLPALRILSLTECSVSAAALAQLTRHGRIEELRLPSSPLTEDALKHIAQMHTLKRLSLRDAGVTDAGLAQLSRMTGLEELWMGDNNVADVGLRHLSKLTNLKVLDLTDTYVTVAGCEELSRHLPRCKIVNDYPRR